MNSYLDNVTMIIDKDDFESEKQNLKATSELSWLPSALDLEGDLNKAWSMFDAVISAMALPPVGIVLTFVSDLCRRQDCCRRRCASQGDDRNLGRGPHLVGEAEMNDRKETA